MSASSLGLGNTDRFVERHVGPDGSQVAHMLQAIGVKTLDELIGQTVPESIRLREPLGLGAPCSEHELVRLLGAMGARNDVYRSYIGMGYVDCILPAVIQRNILENPRWYTQYTPYQAEISQGRLEALLNFQTMVMDLTGMELANASLLDEATAAAEAMAMMAGLQRKRGGRRMFVAANCHPQTIAVMQTRARWRGWEVQVGDPREAELDSTVFAALLQYPGSDGGLEGDYKGFVERAHENGVLVAVAADLLALCLLRPPGEFGADVVVGSTQRFGLPVGYGGPHAAYFATRAEYKRQIPGRIIGVAVDSQGHPALRMALQTREQHIRREKATSNICTAQVLPAVVASMYAVYHGPEGLRRIAARVHRCARVLAAGVRRLGWRLEHSRFFDTLLLQASPRQLQMVRQRALAARINLRYVDQSRLGITVGETTSADDLRRLLSVLAPTGRLDFQLSSLEVDPQEVAWPSAWTRQSAYLRHEVFHRYHSETEMLRYITRLQDRDLSLATSMIPLGSCTMKLNATVEMLPITWPQFAAMHPYAPREQARGYQQLFAELEGMLAAITGLPAVSLQPNAGAQGEFAGLMVIRDYHQSRGQGVRDVCLIPASAHGTNPASAIMAGMQVVVVECTPQGDVDLEDLRRKAEVHADRLAALMITYPSTHGVFEESIREICAVVHQQGAQVYMDGANMNAMVGLCRPADIGIDICHLNLHKTFATPHGGGGPGMGPIAAARHLAPHMPSHPLVGPKGEGMGPVCAAPAGSALVLLIAWAYLRLMGAEGLRWASEIAILNANYVASKLDRHFPILYRGHQGRVAHEAILDLRGLREQTGVTVDDVAKRLMDYGFHAPTVSFPVSGTVMVEPTESEELTQLDRFCAAMIAVRAEIAEVERGEVELADSLLTQAPHTLEMICGDAWSRPYSRERAALPAPWLREGKFWPAVGRVDNAQGDRSLVCACITVDECR